MLDCQLHSLEEAAEALPWCDRLKRTLQRWGINMFRPLYHLLKKLRFGKGFHILRRRKMSERALPGPVMAPLNLQPGERVRVKSFKEIQGTLNEDNKFQGLAYTPAMKKYCGGTYTVVKRVERAFDERRWKMAAIRNVVLLDGVFCDGVGGPTREWDGCDRCCYIWWKEGWLERVADEK
ncbi:MAG TPA: hypothetical protein PKM23_02105 [bacterium]|nr:hypothetical protein [bacterium]